MTVLDGYDVDAGALEFWHPVDDQPLEPDFLDYLDDGDIGPGSSADVRLRVFNTAAAYTAADVTVALAPPVGNVADASGEYSVSTDGQIFAATADLGDLPPLALSAAFTLRRVTPPDGPDGLAGFTITATPTSWEPLAGAPTPAVTPEAAGPDSPEDNTTQGVVW